MKSIIIVLIIGIVAFILFIDDSTNNVVNKSTTTGYQKQDKSPKPVKKYTKQTYALRATDNTWPKISTEQMSVVEQLGTKNYYLIFDGSGSMESAVCSDNKGKINVAKQSVIEFVSKIPGDANIGMFVFDNRGEAERAVLGNSSKQQTIEQIRKIIAGGGTPLKSSIQHGYQALTKQAKKQLGYGEYHLVVVTDGEASSGEDPRAVVSELINKSPVVLHTIGFCIAGNHSLNQKGLSIYKAANNPQELVKGLDSVLAEATDFDVDSFMGQTQ